MNLVKSTDFAACASGMKRILCLNAGSSSLKFKLFDLLPSSILSVVCSGLCERIGDASPSRSTTNFHVYGDHERVDDVDNAEPFLDHVEALKRVERYLKSDLGVDPDDVVAVGHRIVMGRDHDAAVVIDGDVRREIEEGALLAPLHNPPNLLGVAAAEVAFPAAMQVAVFDTAFHTTMPDYNKVYALPKKLRDKYKIRKYGFHGTSYKYLTEQAASRLGKPKPNLILLHLGAGASMCAVKDGRCVDTTMGFTPTAGLCMNTRSGDVDPSVVAFLVDQEGMTADQVEAVLNSESGLFGLCGRKDMRDVHEAERRGDRDAKLAKDVYVNRIRCFLGSFFVQLGGQVDAIVFSGGVGEHDAEIRRRVLDGMEWAGVGTATRVFVIPTDEERSIAQQVVDLLGERVRS